jgi:hypothetical protein
MNQPPITIVRETLMDLASVKNSEFLAERLRDLAFRVGPTHTDHAGQPWTNGEIMLLAAGMATVGKAIAKISITFGTIMAGAECRQSTPRGDWTLKGSEIDDLFALFETLNRTTLVAMEAASDPLSLLEKGIASKAPFDPTEEEPFA